ncbi:outer membrane protein CC2294 [Bacillus freudenreichii]|nr:outer membrane protein CC2294 [Bacillus freudenreichii]
MYYQSPYRTTKRKPNIIKVSGKGKITVEPDIAEVRLGVSTENALLSVAQEENARAISNIKKALMSAGIQDSDVQTIDYSIHPQYDYVEGKQIFRSYKVDHMLLITVREIARAGTIVDTAVNNGANIVSSITFETSDYDRLYRQALSLAVVDARRKAESIAETLNVQLSKVPLLVTEITSDDIVPYQTKTFAVSEASTTFHPGMLEIISHIHAEFTYVLM